MDGAPNPSNGRPRTLGLHHVNLVVADVNRARRFYESALGLEFADEEFEITFLTTPGTGDSLALQQSGGELDRLSGKVRSPGEMGGVDHIGFAVKQGTIDELVTAVEAAGGSVLMRFANDAGEATKVFVADLDGYVLQLGGTRSRAAGAPECDIPDPGTYPRPQSDVCSRSIRGSDSRRRSAAPSR